MRQRLIVSAVDALPRPLLRTWIYIGINPDYNWLVLRQIVGVHTGVQEAKQVSPKYLFSPLSCKESGPVGEVYAVAGDELNVSSSG